MLVFFCDVYLAGQGFFKCMYTVQDFSVSRLNVKIIANKAGAYSLSFYIVDDLGYSGKHYNS